MRRDLLAIGGRGERFLRLERLPSGRVLPGLEGGWATERRQRIAKEHPLLVLGVPPINRVSIWRGGLFWGCRRVGPEHPQPLKRGKSVIPNAQAGFISLHRRLDFHVGGDEVERAVLIGQADIAGEPGGAAAGHFGDAPRPALVVVEILELDPQGRLERFQGLNGRSGAGGVENAQGVMGQCSVPPKPKHACFIDCVLHAVAPQNTGVAPIKHLAQLLAFAEQAAASEAAKAPGDHGAVDLDFERLARLGCQADSAIAEAVLWRLVSMANDVEPGFPSHQFRQIKGDHAGVIGDKARVMRRTQLDQRHRPA